MNRNFPELLRLIPVIIRTSSFLSKYSEELRFEF